MTTTATLETLAADAAAADAKAAELTAQANAARQRQTELAAKLEAQQTAARLAWAERTLARSNETGTAARTTAGEARTAFADTVMTSDIGAAFLALAEAEAAVYIASLDHRDALSTRGQPSRSVVEPWPKLTEELDEALKSKWLSILDQALITMRATRQEAISNGT